MIELLWSLTITAAIWGNGLPGLEIPFAGNIYPYRILVIVLLIAIILLRKDPKTQLRFKVSTLMLFGFVIMYGLLSVMFSPVQDESLKKIINYIINILFLLLFLGDIDCKNKIERVLRILSGNYILLLLLGLFESFTGIYYLYEGTVFSSRSTQLGLFYPLGPLYNTNDFALLLAILLPFVLYYTKEHKNNKKLASLIFLATMFLVLNSESKLILISIFLYFIVEFVRLKNLTKKIRMASITFIIISLALVIMIQMDVLTTIVQDFMSLNLSRGSGGVRFNLFMNAVRLLGRTTFLGVGVGALPYYIMNSTDMIYVSGGSIHNSWLEFFAEFGIICFLLIVVWIIGLASKMNKSKMLITNFKDIRLLDVSLNCILIFPIAVLASSSVTSDPFIWLFFGLIASVANVFDGNKGIK